MSRSPDWLSFDEIPGFLARWEACGCTDRDLLDLQLELSANLTRWPVVPTAGGWRKARFSAPSSKRGKSGGLRVYYADLSEFGLVLLGTAFTKTEMVDLAAKDKRALALLLAAYRRRHEGGE